MAHEVETLMYTSREKPWHGLGVEVQEAPTSKDAIILAGLNWDVESKPIYTDNHLEIPGYKANIRTTDNSVLGIVSNRYKIVQNSEAFDFTDALIGENCKYETAGSLLGGKRVFLLAKLPSQKILGDDFENFICFTNNHDGTGAIQACMTPIRVVCQNTLNLALKQASRKWSARHVGDISSKLAEARHTLELAEEYMENLNVVADQMANTTVTTDDVAILLDDLYPLKDDMPKRTLNTIERKKEDFMARLFAPDISKFRNTAWGVINAASDFSTHSTPMRKTSTYRENKFNSILNGDNLIDNVFTKLMSEKVLKSAA